MLLISPVVAQPDPARYVWSLFRRDGQECGSIIERHQDRLYAQSHGGSGAIFMFTSFSCSEGIPEIPRGNEDSVNGSTF
jgi:hypothetical protein